MFRPGQQPPQPPVRPIPPPQVWLDPSQHALSRMNLADLRMPPPFPHPPPPPPFNPTFRPSMASTSQPETQGPALFMPLPPPSRGGLLPLPTPPPPPPLLPPPPPPPVSFVPLAAPGAPASSSFPPGITTSFNPSRPLQLSAPFQIHGLYSNYPKPPISTPVPVLPLSPAPLPPSPPTDEPPPPPPNEEQSIRLGTMPLVPKDPEVVKKIELLASYVVTHGINFENMAKEKQGSCSGFAFLFGGESGSEADIGHCYYEWKKSFLSAEKRSGKLGQVTSVAKSDLSISQLSDAVSVEQNIILEGQKNIQSQQVHCVPCKEQIDLTVQPQQQIASEVSHLERGKRNSKHLSEGAQHHSSSKTSSIQMGIEMEDDFLARDPGKNVVSGDFGAKIGESTTSARPTEKDNKGGLNEGFVSLSSDLPAHIQLSMRYTSDSGDSSQLSSESHGKSDNGDVKVTAQLSSADSISKCAIHESSMHAGSVRSQGSIVAKDRNERAELGPMEPLPGHSNQLSSVPLPTGYTAQGSDANAYVTSREAENFKSSGGLGGTTLHGVEQKKRQQLFDEYGRLIREGVDDSDSEARGSDKYRMSGKRSRSKSLSRSRSWSSGSGRSRSKRRSRTRSRSRSLNKRQNRNHSRSWSRSSSPDHKLQRRSQSRSPRRRTRRSRSFSCSPSRSYRLRSHSPPYNYRRDWNERGRQDRGGRMGKGRDPPICLNFRKGYCKFGSSCRYLHPDHNTRGISRRRDYHRRERSPDWDAKGRERMDMEVKEGRYRGADDGRGYKKRSSPNQNAKGGERMEQERFSKVTHGSDKTGLKAGNCNDADKTKYDGLPAQVHRPCPVEEKGEMDHKVEITGKESSEKVYDLNHEEKSIPVSNGAADISIGKDQKLYNSTHACVPLSDKLCNSNPEAQQQVDAKDHSLPLHNVSKEKYVEAGQPSVQQHISSFMFTQPDARHSNVSPPSSVVFPPPQYSNFDSNVRQPQQFLVGFTSTPPQQGHFSVNPSPLEHHPLPPPSLPNQGPTIGMDVHIPPPFHPMFNQRPMFSHPLGAQVARHLPPTPPMLNFHSGFGPLPAGHLNIPQPPSLTFGFDSRPMSGEGTPSLHVHPNTQDPQFFPNVLQDLGPMHTGVIDRQTSTPLVTNYSFSDMPSLNTSSSQVLSACGPTVDVSRLHDYSMQQIRQAGTLAEVSERSVPPSSLGDQYDPLADGFDPSPTRLNSNGVQIYQDHKLEDTRDAERPIESMNVCDESPNIIQNGIDPGKTKIVNLNYVKASSPKNINMENLVESPDYSEDQNSSAMEDTGEHDVATKYAGMENVSPAPDWSPKEEKTNVIGIEKVSRDLRKLQKRKKRSDKEARGLKLLRSSVAEYVKESLKPTWRDGQLSKEAFKTIARKAVDKVMGALKSHQIPKSREKVDRFMASSHKKISKLVQGYLDKYVRG